MTQPTDSAKADATPHGAPPSRPTLTVDWDRYGEMLEDADLTEVQKREFLETLWTIIVGFVDLGFGIHPVQQVLDGSSPENILNGGVPDVIESVSVTLRDGCELNEDLRAATQSEES